MGSQVSEKIYMLLKMTKIRLFGNDQILDPINVYPIPSRTNFR